MELFLYFSALFTAAFVAGLWQGLAISLMGTALCSMLPHASASRRHVMLFALFIGAFVLPWIVLGQNASGAAAHGLQIAPWVSALIGFLWLGSTAVRAIQLRAAWRHLCAVRHRATPIAVQGMAELRGGRRIAVLCSSAEVDSPSILGFGSPRLLLPEWMVPQLSQAELQQIVLHECEHLRRGDDWSNLLLHVLVVLAPLNPALLWLNSRIRVQRELAVDAAVVAQTAEPISYATCLTRFAEQQRQRGRLRLALAAMGRRSELGQRVRVLLDRHSVCWTRPQSAWASGAVAILLLSFATLIAHAPQFVHVAGSDRKALAYQPSPALTPVAVSGAQMVPVSFNVNSRQPAHHLARRIGIQDQETRRLRRKAASSRRAVAPNPDQLRSQGLRPANASRHQPTPGVEASVRLVTIQFYSPYVALPTSNGWVFIEL
ncbi:hypothetical protein BH10ACI4_BH10ACI4_18710 [soil metagenome]